MLVTFDGHFSPKKQKHTQNSWLPHYTSSKLYLHHLISSATHLASLLAKLLYTHCLLPSDTSKLTYDKNVDKWLKQLQSSQHAWTYTSMSGHFHSYHIPAWYNFSQTWIQSKCMFMRPLTNNLTKGNEYEYHFRVKESARYLNSET